MSSRAHAMLGLQRGPVIGDRLSKYEQAKFLLTSSAPALIQPEEATTLIDYVVDQSQLFNAATVEVMNTNEKDIRFIQMDSGILRQATCPSGPTVTGSCTESVDISNTNKCLRTMTLDAKFFLCDDDLEDGLTGAQLENQLLRMTADSIANEMEAIALMGNADGSYITDANSPVQVNANVLHLRDGWYRQLQQGNVLDAGNIDADRTLSFHKLNCLIRAIPTQYRTNPAALRIYMPADMWYDYAELHQGRQTDLGDRAHLGPLESRHLTTPIEPVALMPTDVDHCGCGSLAASGTFMFATEPSNLVVGIERNVTFERQRDACQHITWQIWSVRFDMLVFNEDQTSLMDCMELDVCDDGTCEPADLLAKCNTCLDTGSGGEPT